MKLNTLTLMTGLLVMTVSLSACGGKRTKTEKLDVATGDITQPPNVSKTVKVQEPQKAGETISYEEWLRKREAQSLPEPEDEDGDE